MGRGLLTLACLVASANALYFYITEGVPRCFIEEVPGETLIVGHYKNPDFVPFGRADFSGVGLRVTVQEQSQGNTPFINKPLDNEGRFAFTTTVGGEYQVCFATNSSRWFGQPKKFRLDLRLDVGEMGIDYAEVAKKEHLSDLEVDMRRLNDKLKDIQKEQTYQRERERTFRDTSESTNARVQWWSIIQSVVMVLAGVYQIVHLKAFFKSKKVV